MATDTDPTPLVVDGVPYTFKVDGGLFGEQAEADTPEGLGIWIAGMIRRQSAQVLAHVRGRQVEVGPFFIDVTFVPGEREENDVELAARAHELIAGGRVSEDALRRFVEAHRDEDDEDRRREGIDHLDES